ncbi:minor capsid protein [Lacticaseibacillus sp. 866-1]|uniref:minor capsid protein n=1 Tax=Lacticaseibacillus sp. 866-1 TaxID=2799576 RepID=UPI0019418F4E|nr:minor capsid protein [Lacticaseibacillus sp. 866-1]
MGFSVQVNDRGLKRKLSRQGFQRGMVVMANQAAADMNQFVPKKNNHLRSSSVVASDGSRIHFIEPYAHRQWVGGVGWHYTTPGTGPKWDERAKGIYMSKWQHAFVKGAQL